MKQQYRENILEIGHTQVYKNYKKLIPICFKNMYFIKNNPVN